MPRFFILLIITATITSALGFWYYQRNMYSKEALKLEILAPDRQQAFQDFDYILKYKNNGSTMLEEMKLLFEYPDFAIVPEGAGKKIAKKLEDLYPGEERTEVFGAKLVGAVGETRGARASISYSPKNLNAKYESVTTHTAVISSVPLTVELDLPSRTEALRPLLFSVNYFSNSDYPMSGLRIIMGYPPGFTLSESQPKGLGENEWDIGLLNKTEGGRIEIRGFLDGEPGEQKNFTAKLGMWLDGNFIHLKEIARGLTFIRPSLFITQLVNGVQTYAAKPGDTLHYEIFFKNAGEGVFENLFLVIQLDGSILDLNSVRSRNGKFQSGDNSLIWDWQTAPQFKFLAPGQEEKVEFWIDLRDDLPSLAGQRKNLSVRNVVSLSQIREVFETKIAATPKINQTVYYSDEVFGNQGPIPPESGKTTTYTVIWRAEPSYNDLEGAKVRSILPRRLKLTGKIFPEDARLTFDSGSREVVWEIGDVGAVGAQSIEPTVAFQIALEPEEADRGNTMALMGQANLLARDKWAEVSVEASAPPADTRLPDDQSLPEGGAIIQ